MTARDDARGAVDADGQRIEAAFHLHHGQQGFRRALAAATEDAYAKATVLAEATGVTLGRVVGVVETDYDDTAFAGKSFESSAIAVSAHVTVRYLIG